MAPTQRVPPKKDVALALLEQASMYVHLDPRSDAVQVPAWFKKQPQLVLQVGLNMAVPIPDLNVDESGLSCTLSFNRAPFFCMIPWPAVFALVGENGRAMVWAEDVPAEVAAQAQAQKAPEKPRPHLRSVGEHESAPSAEKPAPEPEAIRPAASKRAEPKASKAFKPSAAKPAKEAAKPAARATGKAKPAAKATGKAAAKPASKLAADVKKQPSGGAERPAAPAVAAAPAAVPAKKAAQPKPQAARAEAESSKPKRDLPPYLRVVK